MTLAPSTHYKADLRAIRFTLWDQLGTEQLFELEPATGTSRARSATRSSTSAYRFATEVSGPLNSPGDRTGCRIEGGHVVTPPGFQDAWRKLSELGLMPFTMPVESGRLRRPRRRGVVLQELQSGANTAFNMYPGLTHGAADVIEHFALDEDRKRFLPPMLDGRFSGTMCLSEPHAGSDVGATKHAGHATSRATSTRSPAPSAGSRRATTTWPRTSSTWCWRASRARRPGTKGLSLFIVPKVWVNDDGSARRAQRRRRPARSSTSSASAPRRRRCSTSARTARCRGILVGGRAARWACARCSA